MSRDRQGTGAAQKRQRENAPQTLRRTYAMPRSKTPNDPASLPGRTVASPERLCSPVVFEDGIQARAEGEAVIPQGGVPERGDQLIFGVHQFLG